MSATETKTCTVCKVEKPLTEFYRKRGRKDGHERLCKPCKNAKKAAWLRAVPGRYRHQEQMRDLKRCTPPWADTLHMRLVYEESARLTRETGILHEVDHIVPIKGRDAEGNHVVSGLHTPENLRIVQADLNRVKGPWAWPGVHDLPDDWWS